ncbi:hypothetical protein PG994_001213 [Apiospora phragmitis]|uniref:Uncharacterized protein n=1 Tax=Apiospora phragmitis TaxID=2905665 RepID=A0ABR1WSW8_9PEZI
MVILETDDLDIFVHGVETRRILQLPSDEGDDDEEGANEAGSSSEDTVEMTGKTALDLAACEKGSRSCEALAVSWRISENDHQKESDPAQKLPYGADERMLNPSSMGDS